MTLFAADEILVEDLPGNVAANRLLWADGALDDGALRLGPGLCGEFRLNVELDLRLHLAFAGSGGGGLGGFCPDGFGPSAASLGIGCCACGVIGLLLGEHGVHVGSGGAHRPGGYGLLHLRPGRLNNTRGVSRKQPRQGAHGSVGVAVVDGGAGIGHGLTGSRIGSNGSVESTSDLIQRLRGPGLVPGG